MSSTTNRNLAQVGMPVSQRHSSAERLLSFHRYLPIAAFYFFFNRVGLPFGLFWTSVLSPLLYVSLYLKGNRWITSKFLLILSPFILAHFLMGVQDPYEYFRALLHWWTVYVAVIAICWGLSKCWALERIFDQLILLNFCAAVLGVILYPTPLKRLFWMDTGETIVGTAHSFRLNLQCTEPSAYAELMLPLILFAALRMIRISKMRSAGFLAMIAFPFLLAQSFGGISISIAAFSISVLFRFRSLTRRLSSLFLLLGVASGIAALLLIPSPISARVWQVLSGGDGSTKGRTIMAYVAAYTVASAKSLWWGVGLGQSKFFDFSDVVTGMEGHIPNQVAGTFAEFGILGLVSGLAVQFFLFFYLKVWKNSFGLAMFVAAFINQFTGSYGTDVQQYLLWFFAFRPSFPDTDGRLGRNGKIGESGGRDGRASVRSQRRPQSIT